MKNLLRITTFIRGVATIIYRASGFGGLGARRPVGCNNILTLLLHVCDMDERMRTWILRWIAFQLRNPGAKMRTGLVINGQHFGKSVLFKDVLTELFAGRSGVITADQLHDKFTRWAIATRALIVVHGTFAPRHIARLRALVTAETFIVERRGTAPQVRPAHLNFVFLSGSSEFLPEDVGNRRFAVIETPPVWQRSFHDAVQDEIKNGGIQALFDYLVRDLDMGTFNESTLPPLPALLKQPEAA
jgi:putative DNA primase/helicase